MFPSSSKLKQNTQPGGGQNNPIPVPVTEDRGSAGPAQTRLPGPRGKGGPGHSSRAAGPPRTTAPHHPGPCEAMAQAAAQDGLGLGHGAGSGQRRPGRWPHPAGVGRTGGVGATAGRGPSGQHGPGKGLSEHRVQDRLREGARWAEGRVHTERKPVGSVGRVGGGGGQGRGGGRARCHSHLRSSRLLLGQARRWPGGFWVLCRQASMAELGPRCGVLCGGSL